jgi:hypothetical protein
MSSVLDTLVVGALSSVPSAERLALAERGTAMVDKHFLRSGLMNCR